MTNLLLESPCQDIYCNTRSYTCLQTLIAYLEKYTHTFSEALGVCSEMPRWRGGREQLSPKTQHRGIDLKLGKKKMFTCKAFRPVTVMEVLPRSPGCWPEPPLPHNRRRAVLTPLDTRSQGTCHRARMALQPGPQRAV